MRLLAFCVLAGITAVALLWTLAAPEGSRSFLMRDFLFIPCYTATLLWACWWAASVFRRRDRRSLARLGTVMMGVVVAVASLDVFENVTLLRRGPAGAGSAALAKNILWALVTVVNIYLLAGVVYWLRRRRQVNS